MFRKLPENLAFSMPCVWFGSWFGSGLMARAPGTWGSLAALPFAWALHTAFGPLGLIAGAFILFFLGIRAADAWTARSGEHDPQAIVVDEVVGQWLVLAVLPVPDLGLYLAGFALFRLFDIWKPWPVSWAESRPGGLGVMLDDVFAGIYGAAALWLLCSVLTLVLTGQPPW
ncbi:MAG: phosphatidylglycerophosphatase A family protein [Rhodospirillales bacterium]